VASSAACTADDVRSTIKALALFATRSGLGGNITAEVAGYEARDVLFGRVGAIEVATRSPSITISAKDHQQQWEDPRLAAQRSDSTPTYCIQYYSRVLSAEKMMT